MSMTTRAAICREAGSPWEIVDLELDDPRAGEVRIRIEVAGLCHSDDHVQKGDARMRFPVVGGHEGAGVVEAVGEGVTRVAVGDHVVCAFIPACGTCRYCSTGRQNLCDAGKNASTGEFPDGTFRFHLDGEDLGGMCVLGTFSQHLVVSEFSCIPIPDDISFDIAALVGCGVPTGWGSAVHAAGVRAGETVVVYGAGGVGSNAVQGARYAGAKYVIAVDPLENKREKAMELGATHAFATVEEAQEAITDLTRGQMADSAILTPGLMTSEIVSGGFNAVGKGGVVVLTGLNKMMEQNIELPGSIMTLFRKTVKGSLFGDCNPTTDIPKILGLYQSGDLKLDEIITRTYTLDEVQQGYDDLLAGENIRGVVVHEHS